MGEVNFLSVLNPTFIGEQNHISGLLTYNKYLLNILY